MDDRLRLAQILVSRLCHDVGGLLGTVSGALDLELQGAKAPPDAVTAAAEAAAELTARLRLLREAWTDDATGLDLPGLQSLARGLPGAQRLHLDVSAVPPDTAFAPLMARMVLNVLLLAAEGLPRGGVISLVDAGHGAVLARISGPRAGWPSGLAACLADEDAAWAAMTDARTLLAPLVAVLSRHLGIRLDILLPMRAGRRAVPPLLLSPQPAG
ncbi:MAG TPA: histidine phosphotransferase family protein [Acetobacteraceae bacterium]|nr:histidine phosphotransferase family protein [Acetobacteraceae bacterium]